MPRLLPLLFLLSGFCGVGYQLVWTKQFTAGLGHEMPALLAVMSAFFAGLALGGWKLDRAIARSDNPQRTYALLEFAIGGWALVSATVGMVLRMIEERSERIGRFVAGLLGMAWTMISFLVVPVLVAQRKGPIDALKESTTLLKKTWGEQVVGNFSFGLVFFILSIPAFALGAAGFYIGGKVALASFVGIAVVYLVVLALIQSALQSVFQAAVYIYACGGNTRQQLAVHGFPVQLVGQAMHTK